jgi:hypothetical protein
MNLTEFMEIMADGFVSHYHLSSYEGNWSLDMIEFFTLRVADN